jgi:hypothetical protein
MKRLLLLIFTLTFLLNAQTLTPPAAGDGLSEQTAYEIATVDNLYWLSQNPTEWDKYYKQTADIVISNMQLWDGGNGFTPIGNQYVNFTGDYNGQGYVIDGLYIDRGTENYVGLFGWTGAVVIRQVNITNGTVVGASYAGLLLGYGDTIDLVDCHVSGIVTVTDANSGGLAGYISQGAVDSCSAQGVVSGGDYRAGLLIAGTNSTNISGSFAVGNVSGGEYVGGLVGYFYTGTISNCYARGVVEGVESVSGFTGFTSNITNNNSYSACSVTASINRGGMIGRQQSSASGSASCYWDSEISGLTPPYDVDFGNPTATANMQLAATYVGWDAGVWDLQDGQYPRLQWEAPVTGAAPLVFTAGASDISATSAQLVGLVNPSGDASDYYFEFTEVSGDYSGASQTPLTAVGDGEILLPVSYNLSAGTLAAASTYYYRLVASNSFATVYGNEKSFTTQPIELVEPVGNPRQVSSLANLAWIIYTEAAKDQNYILVNDIDLSDAASWNNGAGFTPIGSQDAPFTGSFDGDGYTLSGLTINNADKEYLGFFAALGSGATISNLTLQSNSVTGGNNTAVLAGSADGASISNCHIAGTSNVSGRSYVSLLIAQAVNTDITDCTVRGQIEGSSRVGGIAGYIDVGTISRCGAAVQIPDGGTYAGGLVGRGDDLDITQSYATGSIAASGYAGGLIGYLFITASATFNLSDCYSQVETVGSNYVGGLGGRIIVFGSSDLAIARCYTTGLVGGDSRVGAAFGYLDNDAIVSNSYWNTTTSGQSVAVGDGSQSGFSGLSDSNMKKEASYAAWDFTSVWRIVEDESYPYLAWEESPGAAPGISGIEILSADFASVDLTVTINANGSPTTYFYRYGLSPGQMIYTTSPQFFGDGTAPLPVNSSVSNLSENSLYYIRMVAENSNGSSQSEIVTFHTTPFYSMPTSGNGDPANPWEISTIDELAWMMTQSERWGDSFELVADLAIGTETASWFSGLGFSPIGTYPTMPFTGQFNGNDYTIDGLTIARPGSDYTAFFGYLQNATVSDIHFTGASVSGNDDTAGLVAFVSASLIDNVSFSGNITGGRDAAGLVALANDGTTDIFEASVEVNVQASVGGYVAGIIAQAYDPVNIFACSASGSVDAVNASAGGLAGQLVDSEVRNCQSDMVIITASSAGGLINYARSSTLVTSFAYGIVNASSEAAGFVRLSNGSDFSDCYAQGPVTALGAAAGFFGRSLSSVSTIDRCYASGAVTAPAASGFASDIGTSVFADCFWDVEASGQSTSDGEQAGAIEGQNTAWMQTQANFVNAGWDFTPVTGNWSINTATYPYLQWQIPATPVAPIATTGAASGVMSTEALLNGTLNPQGYTTTYYFQLGETSGDYNLGNFPVTPANAGNGVLNVAVDASVSGLTPETDYFFRLYAENIGGGTFGSEQTFHTPVATVEPPGSGSDFANAKEISTLAQLLWVSESSARWNLFYKLVADIDATPTAAYNQGAGFVPIGNASVAFTGGLDGQYYSIRNLSIDRGDENDIALIGQADGAVLRQVILDSVSINGQQNVAAMVGLASGATVIEFCYANGQVNGSDNVGGIVGWMEGTSSLANSYSKAQISGSQRVGGLTGYLVDGAIADNYSIGQVTAVSFAGGLVGKRLNGTSSGSYWDKETSGQETSAAGIGRNTLQMQQGNNFSGWDFSNTWRIVDNFRYPDFAIESIVLGIRTGKTNDGLAMTFDDVGPGQYTFSVNYLSDFTPIGPPPSGMSIVSVYSWEFSGSLPLAASSVFASVKKNDVHGIRTPENIRWLQRETNAADSAWNELNTTLDGNLISTTTGLFKYPSGIGVMALGSTTADNPLPVELAAFNASGDNGKIVLRWETFSELHNVGYRVFRSTNEDGLYEEISSWQVNQDLLGAGTSATGRKYFYTDDDYLLDNAVTYYYKLADEDLSGHLTFHGPVSATPAFDLNDVSSPRTFKVHPNYPNPFNPTTTIVVDLEEFTDEALIEVYDITGRLVKTLYNGPINQYRIMVNWDGTNNAGNTLSTGMYFYRYRSANRDIMRKMILMK